jgi:hypothetical protein
LIPLLSGHCPFLVVVPSGDAVVAVLSTGALAGSVGVRVAEIHYSLLPLPSSIGPFLQHQVPHRKVSFVSQLFSVFLELLHVCLSRNEIFVYYIAVM